MSSSIPLILISSSNRPSIQQFTIESHLDRATQLKSSGGYENAIQLFKQAGLLQGLRDEHRICIRFSLAQCYDALNRSTERKEAALQSLELLDQSSEERTWAYLFLAKSYLQERQYGEALTTAQKATSRRTENVTLLGSLHLTIARAHRAQGQYDQGIRSAKEGLHLIIPPALKGKLYVALVQLLQLSGKLEESIIAAREGLVWAEGKSLDTLRVFARSNILQTTDNQ